ncbi:hypothetical protein F4810DRAFT_127959 [Camillea tinctor]|nr:hypothetical protein F4810DRAFT_127959 [Camillea tinctor]
MILNKFTLPSCLCHALLTSSTYPPGHSAHMCLFTTQRTDVIFHFFLFRVHLFFFFFSSLYVPYTTLRIGNTCVR